jgi:hypothetical protein
MSTSLQLDSRSTSFEFDSSEGFEESLLSRTFQRGFDAGQSLSSQQYSKLLPWLLEEFLDSRRGDAETQRVLEEFVEYAARRGPRLAVDVNYVAEGAGI